MVAAARNASDAARGPMTIGGWWNYLPMRIRLAEPLDDDGLLEFCAANGDLRIERTSDGELIIMPPSGAETGNRNFEMNGQFPIFRLFEIPLIGSIRICAIVLEGVDRELRHIA